MLLHAIVLAIKPQFVVEASTSKGLGTFAIAAAFEVTREGKVWSRHPRVCGCAKSHRYIGRGYIC